MLVTHRLQKWRGHAQAIIFDLGYTLVSLESPRTFPHGVDVLKVFRGVQAGLRHEHQVRHDYVGCQGVIAGGGNSRGLRCDCGFGSGSALPWLARLHVRVHLTQKFIIGVGSTVVSQLFGRSIITEND